MHGVREHILKEYYLIMIQREISTFKLATMLPFPSHNLTLIEN
jgi:hypothetical protein